MSTPTGCTYDADGCLVCPEVAPSDGSPARVVTDQNTGWNSGANSIATVDGDLHLVASFDQVPAGAFIGLKGQYDRRVNTDPAKIAHAFYIFKTSGHDFIEVREYGVRRGATLAYVRGATFEIRRVGNEITYLLDGQRLRAVTTKLTGPLLVNACLYSAGDTIA